MNGAWGVPTRVPVRKARMARVAVAVLSVALPLGACFGPAEPVIDARFRVLPSADTIDGGVALPMRAVLAHPEGDTVAVDALWASSKPAVASVDANGVVTGIRTGATLVTATTSFGQARAELVVERAFRAVAASVSDTDLCALDADGLAWCTSGLHDGTVPPYTADRGLLFTQPLSSTMRFSALTATPSYNCGIDVGGEAWCWGRHLPSSGAGGASAIPVRLAYSGRVEQLGGGADELCVRGSAGLFCWLRWYGAYRPPDVPPLAQLSAGVDEPCGLAADGMAWCWSVYGSQLVGGPFTVLTAGHGFLCGVTPAGVTQCRGSNDLGQLGDGSLDADPDAWRAVSGGHSFSDVTAGHFFACARDGSDAVWCWGQVDRNQAWQGVPGLTEPARVTGLPPLVSLHASAQPQRGAHQVCGRARDGALWCWNDLSSPPIRMLY